MHRHGVRARVACPSPYFSTSVQTCKDTRRHVCARTCKYAWCIHMGRVWTWRQVVLCGLPQVSEGGMGSHQGQLRVGGGTNAGTRLPAAQDWAQAARNLYSLLCSEQKQGLVAKSGCPSTLRCGPFQGHQAPSSGSKRQISQSNQMWKPRAAVTTSLYGVFITRRIFAAAFTSSGRRRQKHACLGS